MNRAERRHPGKTAQIRKFLDDLNAIQKLKDAISEEPAIKDGDKVRIDVASIMAQPGYESRLPLFRQFCEENAGKVFTAEHEEGLNPSVMSLKEDTSNPKWLFWVGDLQKVGDQVQDGKV